MRMRLMVMAMKRYGEGGHEDEAVCDIQLTLTMQRVGERGVRTGEQRVRDV